MEDNLYNPQFTKGFSGYKPEEVDPYITNLLSTITSLKEENETLEEKIGVLAESVQKYRDDEDSLREALLGAQKMGDSIIKNANNKAELTMREASVKASHIIQESHQQVEQEKAELIRVQQEVASFKSSLIDMYREHIELITKLPGNEPAAKGETPAEENAEPVSESVPCEEAPEAAAPEAETSAEENSREDALLDFPISLDGEEEESEPAPEEPSAEEIPSAPVPEAGADIFEEFEKKKSEILNYDISDDSEKHSRFADLKFGKDFNLMEDDD